MNTKHSPTPWTLEGNGISIRSADGIRIAEVMSDSFGANARIIVQAVNSHAALIEACKFALSYAEAMGAGGLVEECQAVIDKAGGDK